MPNNTPQYLLTFYQAGDLYSASKDLDRMTVIDNQLKTLSLVVGDGVLSGWTIEATGPLEISVQPGSGFITNVLHKTLTIKYADLYDDSVNSILLQSRLFTGTGGFLLEVQGPFSDMGYATYVDLVPPSSPTSFAAVAVAFDEVNLFWDANLEPDFEAYEIQRSTSPAFTTPVTIGTPSVNGGFPGSPLVDGGLVTETGYYYRIRAVDRSGNYSPFVSHAGFPSAITTPADTRPPAEPTGLKLFPGNAQMSLVFDPSPSTDIIKYVITAYKLAPDGSIDSSYEINNGLAETAQVMSLANGVVYRFRVQSVRKPGSTEIRSDGILAESIPQSLAAPAPVTGLVATPGPGTISLAWTASTSSSGSAMGQKKNYRITVIDPDGNASSPIDVGLATSKVLTSYNESAVVGFGPTVFFVDDLVYTFSVVSMDSFGNESGQVFVKGSTTDLTPPLNPRNFMGTPGDTEAGLSWRHSQSQDVSGYDIFYDAGAGYVPAGGGSGQIGYLESFLVSGLPNGSPITFRIRAIDDAGNISTGSFTVVTPILDTIPPNVPAFIRVAAGDEHLTVSWDHVEDDDLDHYVVTRSAILGDLDSDPNTDLALVPGSTVSMNVGREVFLVDTGLTNGQVYMYYITAVDFRGNESDPSGRVIAAPSEGINESGPDRIEAPENMGVSFSGGSILVTWDFYDFGAMFMGGEWQFTVNVDASPTAFNIWRSTNDLVGYVLVASVPTTERQYMDGDLVGGTAYYYKVSAVRDNADILVDNGSVHPANTVLLGTVETDSGAITKTTNSQRIVENIQATVSEETLSRLLVHRHLTKPINSITTDALAVLSMVDIRDLSSIDLTTLSLSDDALEYYATVEQGATGGDPIDDNTLYIISPNNMVYNVPFVGDFQILVNGDRPSVEFMLEEGLNAIRFVEPLKNDDVVSVGGLGLTYYVPARVDFRFRGYQILVNGQPSTTGLMDEQTQTLRFLSTRAESDLVQVVVEPVVPDFGTQDGPKQVSLSPDIVLSDFTSVNDRTYVSESGIFEEGDTAFALVNGERSSATYTIDFQRKAIIFDSPPEGGSTISLEIRNREEVTDRLPEDRILGVDASSFKSGKFLLPQLPDVSHEGRVKERIYPLFSQIVSSNGYSYGVPQGTIGSGTTPYAAYQTGTGTASSFLLGTSRGLLRSVKGLFLGEEDSASIDETVLGTQFEDSDSPVQIARNAVRQSGRVDGTYAMVNLDGSTLAVRFAPCMVELDDGRVLLTGGFRDLFTSNDAFLYDPLSGDWTKTEDMSTSRVRHACVVLPNGRVLVAGGEVVYTSGRRDARETAEIFDYVTESWIPVGSLGEARSLLSLTVINPLSSTSDVLAAGGRVFDNFPDHPGAEYVDSTAIDIGTAERYSQSSGTWASTGSMNIPVSGHDAFSDGGNVVSDGFVAREIYDPVLEAWSRSDPVLVRRSQLPFAEMDSPIKQFFLDGTGALLAVTRNSVYESRDDGVNFSAMFGLDAVGVVHRVSEMGGTLFAATDLGIYVMSSDLRDGSTWYQSGLIGAGTTEAFDLHPWPTGMLAATEIGVFATVDDGITWFELVALTDVFNIESLGNILYVQAGQDLHVSQDNGSSWTKVNKSPLLGPSTIMVAREPYELFFGTTMGLYQSQDGSFLALVNFDLNRNIRKNNVHMLALSGADVLVGYDNSTMSIDASGDARLVSEFAGVVPTVRVNGEEIRSGFRYDVANERIIFETKRLARDAVSFTSNYSTYQLEGGGWYSQNPTAVVRIFVNGKLTSGEGIATDARLGQFVFESPLYKSDEVATSISGTSLRNEGEFFHSEAEDRLEQEKGLPLSLGRNNTANLLQLGLGIEHNFLERGIDRNQYYCLTGSYVDRSFNSFWDKSEFFIAGRHEYDVFNSTLDYREEARQVDIGTRALIPLDAMEKTPQALWVGTDNGIFILNPLASFAISGTIAVGDGAVVRNLNEFGGDVLAATNQGIFHISDSTLPVSVGANEGSGLPTSIYVTSSVNNLLVAGTEDTIYYSTSDADPPYGVWFRADFTGLRSVSPLSVSGTCRAMGVRDGTIMAAIEGGLYSSTDGKVWQKVFEFASSTGIVINAMSFFAEMLFLGTNKGVYNDRGTARTDTVSFTLEEIEATEADSRIHVNDMFVAENDLYVVGDVDRVYDRRNEEWTSSPVPVVAVHSFVYTSGGRKVALSNNQVFVE